MEQFKRKLIMQLNFLAVGVIGLIFVFIFGLTHESAPSAIGHFIEGVQTGILLVAAGALAVFIHRTLIAIKNPDKLKKLYISETDERILLIRQKSGSVGMNIVMYGLTIGAFIVGNFNDIVFFTLLGVCLFVGLVRVFLSYIIVQKSNRKGKWIMRNSKPHLLLGTGLALLGIMRLIGYYVEIPSVLQYVLMLSAITFILWGVIMFARSPKMRNSRLRHWKLRLIGREPK